eukprot:CAMPEP_0170541654 /NCGR_PEP_ID=MMETSP0211-20121228/1336_1 /TAXON_ID=311385 /ORGANISM="Pseudokeronopsis sp., Strain OXSARD2" /LENGTH=226 /DNA_ID=CAMNT_0010844475 /DNA_START=16 /DNA_END=696 /DNA_ORIENTATION=-
MKDKVIVITGGSRGGMLQEIGKAYILHHAKAVVLMSRNKEKNEVAAKQVNELVPKGSNGMCVSEPGDVRKPDDCKRVMQKTVEKFGKVDVLVNGAAGNFLASASKLSANAFKTVLEIDTMGTMNMSQAAFHASMKDNGGTIINMTAGIQWNGTVLMSHANAAKAGVDALTKTLAVEWGPYKIRVVGIVPGSIEGTEGFARLSDLNSMNSKEKANSAMDRQSGAQNM